MEYNGNCKCHKLCHLIRDYTISLKRICVSKFLDQESVVDNTFFLFHYHILQYMISMCKVSTRCKKDGKL